MYKVTLMVGSNEELQTIENVVAFLPKSEIVEFDTMGTEVPDAGAKMMGLDEVNLDSHKGTDLTAMDKLGIMLNFPELLNLENVFERCSTLEEVRDAYPANAKFEKFMNELIEINKVVMKNFNEKQNFIQNLLGVMPDLLELIVKQQEE